MNKVLYVGEMNPDGTCYSRYVALREIVGEVEVLDRHAVLSRSRKVRLGWIIGGLGIQSGHLATANQSLLAVMSRVRPRIAWIDKADWIMPSTLEATRRAGVTIVQHVTDALYPRKAKLFLQRSLLRKSVRHCHAFLTTNTADAAHLSRRMPEKIIRTRMAYDARRFSPSCPANAPGRPELCSEICFIGHYEPRTARYVDCLNKSGIPVVVYGGEDWARTRIGRRLGVRLRPPVWGEDYIAAIRGTKIALCFLSEWNYNQSTVRTFEIPACGTFMLAMRTAEHEACFQPGAEAAFFSDGTELVALAQRYLGDAAARQDVALRGWRRCVAGRHSWHDVMQDDWAELERRKIV